MLTGESGMGKTHMVDVLRGECAQRHGAPNREMGQVTNFCRFMMNDYGMARRIAPTFRRFMMNDSFILNHE